MAIFAAVLMTGAWALFAVFCWVFYHAIRSYRWPAVKAELLEYGVAESWDDSRSRYVEVRYQYRVNGQTFTGDRLHHILVMSPMRRRILRDLKRLRALRSSRQGFRVHYDPSKPSRSVVFNGVNNHMIGALCFTLSMTLVFTSFFLGAWYDLIGNATTTP